MCYEHFTLKNWRDWGSPKQEFWRCFVCPATMQVILRERMDKKERKEKRFITHSFDKGLNLSWN